MKVKNLVLICTTLLLFKGFTGFSANVKITGKASEYAGNSIQLYFLHDFLSEEKVNLATIQFNAEGFYSLEAEVSETTLTYADFNGYKGMIYLEPGHSYELIFPPKQNLTDSQKRNPFVKPEPIWFGIAKPDDKELNFRIQKFEQVYANLENRYFDQIFSYQSKTAVDSVKAALDKEFQNTEAPLFEAHKKFRKANLDFALNQGKSRQFMENYFQAETPKYNLAAYSTLFNQVFQNYFSVISSTDRSAQVAQLIHSAALGQLDNYLQKKLGFNPALAHWIILKALKDAYYQKEFPKSAVLKMLDEIGTDNWSAYEKRTAQLIRQKLTYLSSGTLPPNLVLTSLTGKRISFSDYANSYIYLHFTDPKNTICQQHLEALKSIAAHYKEKLTILVVIPQESASLVKSEWVGIFATIDNKQKEAYQVKTVPTSFLINKDGKLLLSPAPNPIDGLDRILGQIFKSDYFQEMRKQNSKSAK